MSFEPTFKGLATAAVSHRIDLLLGQGKYPHLVERLVTAIEDPSDEEAVEVAYLTFVVLSKLAQEKHRENTVLNLSSSIFMEIMPGYGDLLQLWAQKMQPDLTLAESELQRLNTQYEHPTVGDDV